MNILSAREADVMRLLIEGRSNSQIAFSLDLQPTTVCTYKRRLFKKLDVQNLPELIQKAEMFE